MKKYLLPENATYYKANLHCHTNLSDAHKTPEEVKKDYINHGYSVVAFTDHDNFYCHNDLTDENFVALNGFELEYYVIPWTQKTCHLCFIAKDPNNDGYGYSVKKPFSFEKELQDGDLNLEEGGMLYKVKCVGRKYTKEYINADIKKAKEMGFYVTYNHPTWSLERYPDYSQYKGFDAMEIANYGCLVSGHEDDNGRVYEDLLSLGNKISCIAADDNHNHRSDEDVRSDSYGCYVNLALDKLNYQNVIKTLEDGMFYSCAKVNAGIGECPHIKNLWFEDGIIHVEATKAISIALIKDLRANKIVISKSEEENLLAEFEVKNCEWFRIVVTNKNGNKAYTNAYFLNDIIK